MTAKTTLIHFRTQITQSFVRSILSLTKSQRIKLLLCKLLSFCCSHRSFSSCPQRHFLCCCSSTVPIGAAPVFLLTPRTASWDLQLLWFFVPVLAIVWQWLHAHYSIYSTFRTSWRCFTTVELAQGFLDLITDSFVLVAFSLCIVLPGAGLLVVVFLFSLLKKNRRAICFLTQVSFMYYSVYELTNTHSLSPSVGLFFLFVFVTPISLIAQHNKLTLPLTSRHLVLLPCSP